MPWTLFGYSVEMMAFWLFILFTIATLYWRRKKTIAMNTKILIPPIGLTLILVPYYLAGTLMTALLPSIIVAIFFPLASAILAAGTLQWIMDELGL